MNVIKKPQATGTSTLLPGLPLASAAPLAVARARAGVAAVAPAQVDAPVTIDSAFKQAAAERARRVLTRDASAAQTGADAALGASHLRRGDGPARQAAHVEKDPQVTVWTNENRIRSKDKTTTAPIPGEVHLTGDGVEAMLVHISGEKPITSVQGNAPFADGTGVPTDAFVQSQVTETLVAYMNKLASYGLNLRSVYRDSEHNDGVIRVFVNTIDVLNAAYVPNRNIYFFGNYKKSFPLGADKDTTIHECSHGLLDHIAPGLNHGESEGGAFHEAFGDIMAAFSFDNAGIGEDLGTYLVEHKDEDPSLRDGIRRVDNDAVLDPTVTEVHDRSLAYSGLMWSTKQALANAIGDDAKACELMQAACVKAAFFITTTNPSSSDLVAALAEGIRSHFASAAPQQAASTVRALLAEAKKRGMLEQPASSHGDIEPFPAKTADDIVAVIKTIPAVTKRTDLSFEVIRDSEFGNLRKVTVRPAINDPKTGTKLPVEDSHFVSVIEDGKTAIVDDSAFSIPAKFDFGRGLPELSRGVDAAREIIRAGLEQAASRSEAAAKILKSFDTLFADENIKAEWVISHGTVCVSLQTLAGDFVVDVQDGKIWKRDTMRLELND